MIDLKTTHLYQEIHEQPAVLAALIEERQAAERLAAEIKRRDVDQVVIAARGTSDNAARYAQYLLGAANGLRLRWPPPACTRSIDARRASAMRW